MSTDSTVQSFVSNNSNADGAQMFPSATLVKSKTSQVNSERRHLETRALRAASANATRGAPAKIIAAETGIAVSEVYELRAERRLPHLATWYALLRRRPDLKPYVEQIVSGEATPEQIAKLIAFFQQSGGP